MVEGMACTHPGLRLQASKLKGLSACPAALLQLSCVQSGEACIAAIDVRNRRHRYRRAAPIENRGALAIELLTGAPVRCSNLDTIHLDRNLVRIGAGKDAQMHLHFPADAVKNEIELEFSLPRSTIDLLDLYLGKFRPKLVRAANNWLFRGEAWTPKQAGFLSNQIASALEREIGVRLTAHQFRHVAGFLYHRRNPGGHEVVRRLLGHKSIETDHVAAKAAVNPKCDSTVF
jgi:integrase